MVAGGKGHDEHVGFGGTNLGTVGKYSIRRSGFLRDAKGGIVQKVSTSQYDTNTRHGVVDVATKGEPFRAYLVSSLG